MAAASAGADRQGESQFIDKPHGLHSTLLRLAEASPLAEISRAQQSALRIRPWACSNCPGANNFCWMICFWSSATGPTCVMPLIFSTTRIWSASHMSSRSGLCVVRTTCICPSRRRVASRISSHNRLIAPGCMVSSGSSSAINPRGVFGRAPTKYQAYARCHQILGTTRTTVAGLCLRRCDAASSPGTRPPERLDSPGHRS